MAPRMGRIRARAREFGRGRQTFDVVSSWANESRLTDTFWVRTFEHEDEHELEHDGAKRHLSKRAG
jgi:hypothetical protein